MRQPEAFLLRNGHALCAVCGKTLSATWRPNGNGVKHAVYRAHYSKHERCAAPRRDFSKLAAEVDAEAWRDLTEWLLEPARIERDLTNHTGSTDPTAGAREAVARQLAQVERQEGNFLDSLGEASSADVRAMIQARLQTIAEQKRGLREELDRLNAQAAQWASDRAWARDFLAAAVDLARSLHEREQTYEGRRELIERFGVVAHIAPDGRCHYTAQFNPGDVATVLGPSRWAGGRSGAGTPPWTRRSCAPPATPWGRTRS
jgi:hypothetical protein